MTDNKWTEFVNRLSFGRVIMFLAGVLLINFGIAFSIKGNLGTAPVASLPFTLSQFTSMSIGNWTIIVHSVAVLLQFLILRKDYNPVDLSQILVGIIFGKFTDMCVWIVRSVSYTAYWQQWILTIIGTILIGIGVTIEVRANVLMVAFEGLATTISKKAKKNFGNVKSIQDLTIVAISCIIGLIALGKVVGVREGTVFAAIFVGQISKLVRKFLDKFNLLK